MKTILVTRKKTGIAAAVLSALVGITLLIYPETSIRWMCMAVGFMIFAAGVTNFVSHIRGVGAFTFMYLDVVLAVVLSVVGLWMMVRPETVVSAMQYVFGVIILIRGAIDLQASIDLRRAGGNAGAGFAACALTIVLAVLILLDPFKSLAVLVRMIGAVLVFNGIVDLYLIISLSGLSAAIETECGPIEAEFVEIKDDEDKM